MKNRVTVLLEFKLANAQRLFLIVRGPAPSCDVVGVIPVRGHKGANAVGFAGRVGRRYLRPGDYLVTLSTVRRPAGNAPATLVEVVSKRRTVPAGPGALRPTCAEKQTLAAAYRLLRAEGKKTRPTVSPAAVVAASPVTPVSPAPGDRQHEVLGVAIPGSGLEGASAGWLAVLITIAVLTLLGAIMLTTALVTRFVRGSWNP